MTNKKKVFLVFGILFLVFLIWYLFIKKEDYTVRFSAKTATGTAFQGIEDWTKNQKKAANEDYKTIKKSKYSFLKHSLQSDTTDLVYCWNIEKTNDSISSISVGITDNKNSIYNRLTAPFWMTDFKKESLRKVNDLRDGLNTHIENFRIKIEGNGESKPVFVAYMNMQSVMQEKARTMIKNDIIITTFLFKNKISIIDKPYVEILDWNQETEILDFNYCFPVDANTKPIDNEFVKFKTIAAQKGIKATYFGNFRTSDRAWFAVLDYAKKQNLKLDYKPLEHYLDNPFNGGIEKEWKTTIIIPYLK